jgi:sugar O-acyltransferase (sialic acid O-acetyltransferase NeuD family)
MVQNDRKFCIAGVGGFGRETLCCLIDMISGSGLKIEETACFMVSDEYFREEKIMGIEVIPLSKFDPAAYQVVVAISEPKARKKFIEGLPGGTVFGRIIHPQAIISQWAEIGEGCIITAGVIITCNIKIGRQAHLNLHTSIGHDCVTGDYFTTAPAANISGNCTFGDCVYFGTNSAVRNGIKICDNVTVGMGGIVVKDITEEGVYIGNPLKKLEKK